MNAPICAAHLAAICAPIEITLNAETRARIDAIGPSLAATRWPADDNLYDLTRPSADELLEMAAEQGDEDEYAFYP